MENQIYSDTFLAMNTRCDVVFIQLENEFAEQIFRLVKTKVKQIENILSRNNSGSPVFELNRADKNIWLNVPDDLWNIITLCFDFYQMSNGAFDITVAPLISLWENNEGNKEISSEEIKNAKSISGFDKVDLDYNNQKIRFKTDGIEFDFGAIEKGFILDSLKPLLQQNGVKNAIISFGESSILALGNHPNGENWPLGIRNTKNMNEYVHVFSASNETITTSGTILKTGEDEIESRNCIISPATGLPVEKNKTVSVKSESASLGEFISTSWLILPDNDKEILFEQIKQVEVLEVSYYEGDKFETKLSIL